MFVPNLMMMMMMLVDVIGGEEDFLIANYTRLTEACRGDVSEVP